MQNINDSGYVTPTPIQMQAIPAMLKVKNSPLRTDSFYFTSSSVDVSSLLEKADTGLRSYRIRKNGSVSYSNSASFK